MVYDEQESIATKELITDKLSAQDGVIEINSRVNLNNVDLRLETTTGTKIGTDTSQKLGFWNATPVVQQVVAGGANIATLITALTTMGIVKAS